MWGKNEIHLSERTYQNIHTSCIVLSADWFTLRCSLSCEAVNKHISDKKEQEERGKKLQKPHLASIAPIRVVRHGAPLLSRRLGGRHGNGSIEAHGSLHGVRQVKRVRFFSPTTLRNGIDRRRERFLGFREETLIPGSICARWDNGHCGGGIRGRSAEEAVDVKRSAGWRNLGGDEAREKQRERLVPSRFNL